MATTHFPSRGRPWRALTAAEGGRPHIADACASSRKVEDKKSAHTSFAAHVGVIWYFQRQWFPMERAPSIPRAQDRHRIRSAAHVVRRGAGAGNAVGGVVVLGCVAMAISMAA